MPLLASTGLALPLRNANYGIYTGGNAVSLVGTWMQRITVGWFAWELTHSGFWLGLIAFAEFFPVLLIGPVAGAVADRRDQLRIVKASQAASLVQALALVALTVTGTMTIVLLTALTACQGAIVAFNQPARLALIPSLVAARDLAPAVAINSVIFNLARFVGPMLAGIAIASSGLAVAFALNALSYVAFLLALQRVRIDVQAAPAAKRKSMAADLRAGIGYTARHAAIRPMLLMMLAIGVGVRPLNDLLPGLAVDLFRSGAVGLSILASATGAGAIVAGLWLAHRAWSAELVTVALWTSLGGALAAVAVCATDNMWIAVPSIAAFGFCMSSSGIAIQTIIQLAADRSMRGRVMGLYGLVFRGAPAVGALAAGSATVVLGLRWPIVIGAVVLVSACAWTWLRHAPIRAAVHGHAAEPLAAPVPD